MRASDIFLKRDRAKAAKEWMEVRGVKFLVASAMKDGYQEDIAEGESKKIAETNYYTYAVADHLLIDWKGLDNEDDKTPMECTQTTKRALLKDYTEIGSLIVTFASAPSNFVAVNYVEEEVGNS